MASIKLDPNKAYRVNFRLLEAAGPSAVKIEVNEKPVATPPPAPVPGTPTCTTKPSQIWNVVDPSNSTHYARYFQYMRLGDVWSVKFPKRSELIARAPDRFPGAGGPNSDGAGGVGDGIVQFFIQIWGYSGQLQHPPPEGVEHAISYCAGDFDTAPAGYSDWNQKHYKERWQDPFSAGGFGISYASPGWNDKTIFKIAGNQYTVSESSLQDVIVDPNREFYINFRYTKVAADRTDKLHGMAFEFIYRQGILPSVTGTGTGPSVCTDQPVAQFKDFTPQTIFRGDFYNLKNGEIGSVKVKPSLGNQKSMSFIVANPAPGGEISDWTEAVISECRGSFEIPPGNAGRENRCRVNSQISEITIDTHCGTTPNQFQCILDPNKDYYINFRYKNPNTNQNTCQVATGCSSIVSIGYGP